MVMKSGVKFGRDGILSERKFQLVHIDAVREKTKKTSNDRKVTRTVNIRAERTDRGWDVICGRTQ
jgi:hypothetical protein